MDKMIVGTPQGICIGNDALLKNADVIFIDDDCGSISNCKRVTVMCGGIAGQAKNITLSRIFSNTLCEDMGASVYSLHEVVTGTKCTTEGKFSYVVDGVSVVRVHQPVGRIENVDVPIVVCGQVASLENCENFAWVSPRDADAIAFAESGACEDIRYYSDMLICNDTDWYDPGFGFEPVGYWDKGEFLSVHNKPVCMPVYGSEGAAGADLFAMRKFEIGAGETVLIPTGVKASFPSNVMLNIYPRSSLHKRGLTLANCVGVVDSDYYNNESNGGELLVAMRNFSDHNTIVEYGERIAQAVFTGVIKDSRLKVLNATRKSGFGSTGVY